MHSECCRKCTEMRQCHAHVSEWHKQFKDGCEDVGDDSRSGRPSMSRTVDNIERLKQMVRGDLWFTVLMIADELEINRDSVWKIIMEDLGMRKICAKMVPKLLDDDQKERRVEVSGHSQASLN